MRKPAFCIYAKYQRYRSDQLRSNCAADQRLCFSYIIIIYIDSTIHLLPEARFSCVVALFCVIQS